MSDSTRAELEAQAFARTRWLTQVQRLLPRVIDRDGLNAALVAARLEQANESPETDL